MESIWQRKLTANALKIMIIPTSSQHSVIIFQKKNSCLIRQSICTEHHIKCHLNKPLESFDSSAFGLNFITFSLLSHINTGVSGGQLNIGQTSFIMIVGWSITTFEFPAPVSPFSPPYDTCKQKH